MRLIKRWEHQWLADEDIYVHQDGYVIQQSVSEEKLKSRITPINNVPHSAAWQRVVDLQEILLGRKCQSLTEMTDNQKIRELLVDVDAWPMDIGILDYWNDGFMNDQKTQVCS